MMPRAAFNQYQSELFACRRAFDAISLNSEAGYAVRLAFFSANLTNFLPNIPIKTHESLFQRLLLNMAFENIDRKVIYSSEIAEHKGQINLLENQQQFIICTFHLGSYRLISNELVRAGYNYSVLVRGELYEQERAAILDTAKQAEKYYGTSHAGSVMNAEDPKILLQTLRELREGKSLLVYLDGNVGSGSDEKLEPVQFLAQQIGVRKGMAYVSYMSGVPILPVISYRKPNLKNVLVVGKPIYADKTVHKDIFAKKTMQKLYSFLEKYVEKYPEQWEAWNYAQNFMMPKSNVLAHIPTKTTKHNYAFNHHRYALLDMQESSWLFDKKNYQTFEISNDLSNYLSCQVFAKPKVILGRSVFDTLLQNEVLV
jgi:lauroyl/myristoyl acyltransferase